MVKLESLLDRDEILKLYSSGCKNKTDFGIGLEYERLPISSSTMKAKDYWDGVEDFLIGFAKENNWTYITDENNIIGLKNLHDTITLEPGSQIELSIQPEKTVFDLKNKIERLNSIIKLALPNDTTLLEYGVSPYSTSKSINLIPKRRYKLMAVYLWGILSDVMMRETSGIQCGIDFSSEEDAVRKYKLANKLSPFMTAMFANSPIRGGVNTGYKSFRALSWLNTDNDRCGFYGKISEEYSFEDYIDRVMKTPMIFVQRDGIPINFNGNITFEEFIEEGYEGLSAKIEDYELQANLCFPEVRMRNFLEIRNHDCVSGDLKYSIPAIYKGIMYDEDALKETEDLLKPLQYKDFSELRYNVPKHALNTKIKNHEIKDYAKEIINIAENSLRRIGQGEEIFIEPIKELVADGLCPADIIIKNWDGIWHRDIRRLIDYIS